MAAHFDLVIRNGLIMDGIRAAPFVGDVAITGTRIAAVGEVGGKGKREIDVRGQIVTPGFVDFHTHYDGQAIWSDRLNPSSAHGVTTVIVGNCGVGFASCRPDDHDLSAAMRSPRIPMSTRSGGRPLPSITVPPANHKIESFPHQASFFLIRMNHCLRIDPAPRPKEMRNQANTIEHNLRFCGCKRSLSVSNATRWLRVFKTTLLCSSRFEAVIPDCQRSSRGERSMTIVISLFLSLPKSEVPRGRCLETGEHISTWKVPGRYPPPPNPGGLRIHSRFESSMRVLDSRNARSPSTPPSRPMPDCLKPPNAMLKSDLNPLWPTVPDRSCRPM
jgi:hypothetical protein